MNDDDFEAVSPPLEWEIAGMLAIFGAILIGSLFERGLAGLGL